MFNRDPQYSLTEPASAAPPPATTRTGVYVVVLGDAEVKVKSPAFAYHLEIEPLGEFMSEGDLVARGAAVTRELFEREASEASVRYLVVALSAPSFGRARFRGKEPDPIQRGFDSSVRRVVKTLIREMVAWRVVVVTPLSNRVFAGLPWAQCPPSSSSGSWSALRLDCHAFWGRPQLRLTLSLRDMSVKCPSGKFVPQRSLWQL